MVFKSGISADIRLVVSSSYCIVMSWTEPHADELIKMSSIASKSMLWKWVVRLVAIIIIVQLPLNNNSATIIE